MNEPALRAAEWAAEQLRNSPALRVGIRAGAADVLSAPTAAVAPQPMKRSTQVADTRLSSLVFDHRLSGPTGAQ